MGFLSIVLNVVALIVGGARGITIVSLIAAIWAYGIASNFRGEDPRNMPTYAAWLGFGSFITGIVMIIVGVAS